MTKVLVTEGTLYDIADAIREKNGESQTYRPKDMPAAILRITTQDGEVQEEVIEAYVTSSEEYGPNWLSGTQGGNPLTPQPSTLYVIVAGDRANQLFRWNGDVYIPIAGIIDAELSLTSGNAVENRIVSGALALKAPLDSPALTGNPTAPTQAFGDSSTKVATTAFVQEAVTNVEVDIATAQTAGTVRPDGTSLTVAQDGTLSIGQVPSSALPSYVDDVLEGYLHEGTFYGDQGHTEAMTGESGKIYVDLTDGTPYRWSGSAYVAVGNPLDIATESEARAGADNQKAMTPLRVAQAIEATQNAVADIATELAAVSDGTPTKTSDLTNDSGFIVTESDPTVPAWAKEATKPTYTAQEVGALPSTTAIPSKVSDLTNDSGFITSSDVATTQVAGTVIPDGTTITVDQDGTIHGSQTYQLPTMGVSTKGGAVLGDGLEVTGDVLSVKVDGDGPIRSLTGEGHAEQVQMTGKNLWPKFTETSVINGVTFTPNEDGSVSVSGANTSSSNNSDYRITNLSIGPGTYTGSGFPNGGSSETYSMVARIHNTNTSTNRFFYMSSGNQTFTVNNNEYIDNLYITIHHGYSINGTLTFYPQLEAGSVATEYEPYCGGIPSPNPDYPQEIEVVRGRNLLRVPYASAPSYSSNGITVVTNADGSVTIDGTATATAYYNFAAHNGEYQLPYEIGAGNYILSTGTVLPSGISVTINRRTNDSDYDSRVISSGMSQNTFSPTDTGILRCYVTIQSGTTVSGLTLRPQLEPGSAPTPYVPYGHVGLEVTHDGTTEAVPVPLPSRGWVGSLPDGTADTLTIDGAGHVTWELACEETDQAVTDGITGTVGVDVMSTTGEIADGATVLYGLATTVTEDMGYVDAEVPVGAEVDVPDLAGVSVVRWVDARADTLARQWYRRAESEIGTALVELAARVAALESE